LQVKYYLNSSIHLKSIMLLQLKKQCFRPELLILAGFLNSETIRIRVTIIRLEMIMLIYRF